jgi:eukaryotic-like serine/threonine-protein kinase
MDAKPLDEPDASVTFGPAETPGTSDEGAPAYAPGDLVTSKYRLTRPLGAGGQAAVWEAQNLLLEARVALKLLHDRTADDAQVARLLREARAVARLGHPAVVRVFDLAKTDRGELFIVMELLEGRSLADELLERRRLSAVEAVQLLLPIVDALGAAHAQGIVHRDVKPDNIVITRAGSGHQPKLLDFGVAKLKREAENAWSTVAGTVLGTPAYLSPEQAEGSVDIDLRTDVWSLSATLYECVTGTLPFDAESDDELFARIAAAAPASILEHAVGDAELWAIVRRGLAKAREDRWPSMRDLGEALARWLARQGVSRDATGVSLEGTWLKPSAAAEAPRRRLLLRAAIAGAFIATIFALALLGNTPRTPDPAEQRPLLPIDPLPRPPEPTVAPLTAVPLATPLATPPTSVMPPKSFPSSLPAPSVGTKPKAARERSQAAPLVAGDGGLDLLSPYR